MPSDLEVKFEEVNIDRRVVRIKVFAKSFLQRHGIPTAAHATFTSTEEAVRYLGSRGVSYPTVLKVDGLAAGKGVLVAEDRPTAEEFARAVLERRIHGNAIVPQRPCPRTNAQRPSVHTSEGSDI